MIHSVLHLLSALSVKKSSIQRRLRWETWLGRQTVQRANQAMETMGRWCVKPGRCAQIHSQASREIAPKDGVMCQVTKR